MKKYEGMFIVNPELGEEAQKELLTKIRDVIEKNNGKLFTSDIWSEKRKLYFPIKKYREGIYYLVNFSCATGDVSKIAHEYKLNENILRVLITTGE
jgi:small subunit ribosomal protein S6